jgi:nucleolar protein 15
MAPTVAPKKSKKTVEKQPSKSKEKVTSIVESSPNPPKRKMNRVDDEELATEGQSTKKAKKNVEFSNGPYKSEPKTKATKATIIKRGSHPASKPHKPSPNPLNSISFPKQKSSKKSKAPAPEMGESDDEPIGKDDSGEEEAGPEAYDENEDHLHGFSTDGDSSDEESDADDPPVEFDMEKLPTIAKDDETVKRKLDKAKRQPVRNDLSL